MSADIPVELLGPTFQLQIDGAAHAFVVVSFRGRERLSRPFTFDVRVTGPTIEPELIEAQYVGATARLLFGEGESARWIHGVIRRMDASGTPKDGPGDADARSYRLEIVPRLRLLGYKRNSRIFQDRRASEIVQALLAEANVPVRVASTGDDPVRPYCVQHRETDLDFVERLLAEEGIFYWFEHPDAKGPEVMVLGHSPQSAKPLLSTLDDKQAVFRVSRREDMARTDDRDLSTFRVEHRVQPSNVLLRAFDYQRPSFDRRGEATAKKSSVRPNIEQYHHDFGELELDGAFQAETRLEQHRRKVWVGAGEGYCASFSAGARIEIEDAQLGLTRGEKKNTAAFTLIDVVHQGFHPRAVVSAGAVKRHTYCNTFQCVPAHLPFRPRHPEQSRRARPQQIMETATIVGPAGQEIHTDEQGRVKVQFHWDRESKRDGASSCWIRVMQPWAGAGWGFQFIPRVGMEVMVAFLAGDPDRPMIVGSVYNAEHPPTFPLPAERSKSGIRTRSTPKSDGYNEISFEDKAGEEAILIRAQSHLNETVNVNHTTKVGKDRNLVVEGNQTASVGGDAALTVAGNKRDLVKKNRAESTSGNSSVTVKGNRDERIDGNHTIEVNGNGRTRYRKSAAVRVDQNASLTAASGLSVNVGASDAAMGVLHAKGNWVIGSDAEIVLHAQKGISIQCGSSILKIKPDHIEISASTVAIKGNKSVTAEAGASVLELGKEAKLASKATRLFGASSSMELSANAYLKGMQIKLNEQEGDPPRPAPGVTPPPTRPFSLKLSDGAFNAFADRPYELTIDGVRYKGRTDAAGNVKQDIPTTATKAHLLVWEGEPPAGKHHVWDLSLKSPPPVSSIDGARSRLANLGYEVGSGKKMDKTTKRAVIGFQEDHGLTPTGEIDRLTSAKLVEVHGH